MAALPPSPIRRRLGLAAVLMTTWYGPVWTGRPSTTPELVDAAKTTAARIRAASHGPPPLRLGDPTATPSHPLANKNPRRERGDGSAGLPPVA
uniref:Uncharacterized protein n=1 Tax=Oryza nivara TaxID=4536 RepID=A0A0E0FRU5_ORYNI